VHIHKTCVSVLCVAGLVGCSAAPYAVPTLAPPDRLHAFVPPLPPTLMDDVLSWGTSAYVPLGDGSGDLAPNYAGYIPSLGGRTRTLAASSRFRPNIQRAGRFISAHPSIVI
jgi:hypothetical protein